MWYSPQGLVSGLNLYTDIRSAFDYHAESLWIPLFVLAVHPTRLKLSSFPFVTPGRKMSSVTSQLYKQAIKIYDDPSSQRDIIRKDLRGKSGVYAWINKINNKVYVGSGTLLYKRLANYYQPWSFKQRPNMLILRALLKYGMVNFTLVILEFSDVKGLLECEQK